MEQTLGKRIAANRKRLGLTQDQLAERLGVTAQAVSKWENDQSCPDITTLPRLADIFGISADELLGMEQDPPVHHAEVVEEEPNGSDRGWEFRWDSGRRHALGTAAFVLLVGGLMLASQLLSWDAGFWSIVWPSALLMMGLTHLFPRFSFFALGCTLFGGYALLDNLGFMNIPASRELIFPVVLILFGLSLLMDALRTPKKPRFTVTRNGKRIPHGKDKFNASSTVEGDHFNCSASFGGDCQLIRLPLLRRGDADCSFGELTVDLSGCEAVSDDCIVNADCSFGSLKLLIPRRFRAEVTRDTAFASVDVSGHADPNAVSVIRVRADANFGQIQICYI